MDASFIFKHGFLKFETLSNLFTTHNKQTKKENIQCRYLLSFAYKYLFLHKKSPI